LTGDQARRLAKFVLAGDEVRFTRESGLRFEYFEADDFPGPEPEWDAMQAIATGLTDAIGLEKAEREDQFGLRLMGGVTLPVDGTYTFYLTSDDGSMFDLDGQRVIDHGGLHGDWTKETTLELEAGFHPLVVTMFERTGGEVLRLEFEAPGVERREFASDELFFDSAKYTPPAHFPAPGIEEARALTEAEAARATGGVEGRALFTRLGCVACHSAPGLERQAQTSAPALVNLSPGVGCLASDALTPGQPRFRFREGEQAAIGAYLAAPSKPMGTLSPKELLARELPRLGCLACHERDGLGGPSPAARPFFTQSFDGDDLGVEGHFPPSLTGVGAKLRPAWLAKVIAAGSHGGAGVRPYLTTEMPSYPSRVAERLAAAFVAVDLPGGAQPEPAFDEVTMEVGRQLVGTTGFGCIVCHEVAGKPSLGIPMIDLATTPERLRFDWFRRWVEEPTALRPKTRMAGFWPGGKSAHTDILDGEAEPQIAAIWTYLSLGVSMPLPDGLNLDPAAYDLEPKGRPIYHACFWRGGSARGLAVGFPARKHLAFDEDNLRIAALWFGGFVNAADTWDGRAGGLVVPASEGVLHLPSGMAVAELDSASAPWPETARRELGWRYLGYRRDSEGVPTFRYAKGKMLVEESLSPQFGAGGRFVRRFHFEGLEPGCWFVRLGAGETIADSAGTWTVRGTGLADPEAEVRIVVDAAAAVFEGADGSAELRVALSPDTDGTLDVEVSYQW
jgi:mono/diheme cytochrome c family protein